MAITKFRPCIDLHEGKVKQIVGGTLTDEGATENFVSEEGARHFAKMFGRRSVDGEGMSFNWGREIGRLRRSALAAWPGGLQLGGGVTIENAASWLEAGAGSVIVTSYLV